VTRSRALLAGWLTQVFDRPTVVVYDLEWTSWLGFMESGWRLPGKHRETIQIGAVRLDAGRGFAEIGAFETLVRPHLNPLLSDYIVDLTGINQARIDRDGVSFDDALDRFVDFVGDSALASWGPDEIAVTENCVLWDRDPPPCFAHPVDVREPVSRQFGFDGPWISSSDLPDRLGLAVDGRAHDALYDARCIGAALCLMDASRKT
jgi:inhibitor of KinA sporulation pathway (predicted exonuclease)